MNIVIKTVLCTILNTAICSAGAMAKSKVETDINVIIIGSGAAGIAAAARLMENDITNITILEAEDRIGGRIHSVHFGDAIVDLGAEWCDSGKANKVYKLANGLNVLESDPLKTVAYYHSSQKHLDRTFVRQIHHIANDVYYKGLRDGIKSSLGDYILQRFNATITKDYGDNPQLTALAHEIIDAFQLAILTDQGAFSWFDIAAQTNVKNPERTRMLDWKDHGYKTILDVLIKKYPNPDNELPVYKRIIFRKEVRKISWIKDRAEVECSDNTTYVANQIMWTPSLGVLKYRYKDVFEPALPKEKINAIETVGIDAVIKVFYYFPQRWWPNEVRTIAFIWSKRDAQNVWNEFPYGSETQKRAWILGFRSMSDSRYNPNVLSAWICGEDVPGIEKLQDEAIINGTMFLLHKFLGYQFHNITRPQKILREKWYTNDHFRGTYSYDTLASRAEGISQRDILSTPLKTVDGKPVVLFAGEATNPNHFGTVHGAIETGYREADRIINYYKEIQKEL